VGCQIRSVDGKVSQRRKLKGLTGIGDGKPKKKRGEQEKQKGPLLVYAMKGGKERKGVRRT